MIIFKYSDEEDFMLGIMLGYSRVKNVSAILKAKNVRTHDKIDFHKKPDTMLITSWRRVSISENTGFIIMIMKQ